MSTILPDKLLAKMIKEGFTSGEIAGTVGSLEAGVLSGGLAFIAGSKVEDIIDILKKHKDAGNSQRENLTKFFKDLHSRSNAELVTPGVSSEVLDRVAEDLGRSNRADRKKGKIPEDRGFGSPDPEEKKDSGPESDGPVESPRVNLNKFLRDLSNSGALSSLLNSLLSVSKGISPGSTVMKKRINNEIKATPKVRDAVVNAIGEGMEELIRSKGADFTGVAYNGFIHGGMSGLASMIFGLPAAVRAIADGLLGVPFGIVFKGRNIMSGRTPGLEQSDQQIKPGIEDVTGDESEDSKELSEEKAKYERLNKIISLTGTNDFGDSDVNLDGVLRRLGLFHNIDLLDQQLINSRMRAIIKRQPVTLNDLYDFIDTIMKSRGMVKTRGLIEREVAKARKVTPGPSTPPVSDQDDQREEKSEIGPGLAGSPSGLGVPAPGVDLSGDDADDESQAPSSMIGNRNIGGVDVNVDDYARPYVSRGATPAERHARRERIRNAIAGVTTIGGFVSIMAGIMGITIRDALRLLDPTTNPADPGPGAVIPRDPSGPLIPGDPNSHGPLAPGPEGGGVNPLDPNFPSHNPLDPNLAGNVLSMYPAIQRENPEVVDPPVDDVQEAMISTENFYNYDFVKNGFGNGSSGALFEKVRKMENMRYFDTFQPEIQSTNTKVSPNFGTDPLFFNSVQSNMKFTDAFTNVPFQSEGPVVNMSMKSPTHQGFIGETHKLYYPNLTLSDFSFARK